MRVLILAAIAALAPVAAAQPGPRVVIEDDVSHDNAIKCSALRMTQVKAATDTRAPDALLTKTHEAWTTYLKAQPGYEAEKTKAETEARINTFKTSPSFFADPGAFLDTLSGDCATFEIRAAG